MDVPKVAVIGCGYWGKNLVRVFHELHALAAVCDVSERVRETVSKTYGVHVTSDVREIVEAEDIDAAVIAAPAVQHYELARLALSHGKDVFVEKPLALSAAEGRELADFARLHNRILMVGHILEYHPAIRKLKQLVSEGQLGKIEYIYSSRLNIGKLRTEENILWSFAPHDVAVILSLLKEFPSQVTSRGGIYLNQHVFDTTLMTCEFDSGVMAHIFVSWLHPFKEQKLCVIGDRCMAVFDDVKADDKLVLYPHTIEWVDRTPIAKKNNCLAVPLPKAEPLQEECAHFLQCVSERKTPLTDAESGVRVLRVLEACGESLRNNGNAVAVSRTVSQYYAHPTAVIDQPCEIGKETKIWHFCHVMAGSKIGERCNFGQNVLISPGVCIGNNVKVQNNVSIYTGVELEDDVFCGPSMVFTNVVNPRSHIVRKNEYKRTLVKHGATLGANSTIVCGVTIGEYAFVGAGAVVTRDVADYALMVGVPARQIGWMCYCGSRLPDVGHSTCAACGRSYLITGSICKAIDTVTQERNCSELMEMRNASSEVSLNRVLA